MNIQDCIQSICANKLTVDEGVSSLLENPITVYKAGKKALQNKDNIKKAAQMGVELYHNVKKELDAKKKDQEMQSSSMQPYSQPMHYYSPGNMYANHYQY